MDEITLTFMIGRHLEAASFFHIFLSPFICFSPPQGGFHFSACSSGVACHLGGTEAQATWVGQRLREGRGTREGLRALWGCGAAGRALQAAQLLHPVRVGTVEPSLGCWVETLSPMAVGFSEMEY